MFNRDFETWWNISCPIKKLIYKILHWEKNVAAIASIKVYYSILVYTVYTQYISTLYKVYY